MPRLPPGAPLRCARARSTTRVPASERTISATRPAPTPTRPAAVSARLRRARDRPTASASASSASAGSTSARSCRPRAAPCIVSSVFERRIVISPTDARSFSTTAAGAPKRFARFATIGRRSSTTAPPPGVRASLPFSSISATSWRCVSSLAARQSERSCEVPSAAKMPFSRTVRSPPAAAPASGSSSFGNAERSPPARSTFA